MLNFTRLLLVFVFILGQSFSAISQNVKLISWNIRDFGKTKDETEIRKIAQIVRDYDIVAIQEVVAGFGGAQAVARLTEQLNRMGSQWDYKVSPPTDSPKYKTERYAFLWKPSKVKLIGTPVLASQYAEVIYREPYIAQFQVDTKKIRVINYHSRRFDEQPEEEVFYFPYLIRDFPNENIIIAGDFNLRHDDVAFLPLKSAGYEVAALNQKTTLKKGCGEGGVYLNHPIDNIFYNSNVVNLLEGGVVDFVRECTRLSEARQLSDHLAVYLEFGIVE